MKPPLVATVVALLLTLPLYAGAGDPTIETDHPDYPGEGAFQTVEQCVRWATRGQQSSQDKAIALFNWMLTHQFHLMSPQEYCVPGKRPDSKSGDQEMIVYDANRSRFSYGYGLCGTVHAWNEPYWKALGMNSRRRAFPGHTNSEIEYDGGWHAFDTDMAGLVFRKDGVVAGYDDIVKDPTLVDVDRSPLPRYPFAWPGDFNGMKAGWKEVSAKKDWYKLYNAGYAAQPGIVQLRSGETFTRYFDRDHFGGPAQRRFWHNQPGGPFRDWTFVNMGRPEHRGAKSNSRGNASYCNGEFIYRPDLTSIKGKEVVFDHFSPYVICGDPADDANPMTGPATSGLVVQGKGTAKIAVSTDQGQTWTQAGEVTGSFSKDLTDLVKGRYGWQIRFELAGWGALSEVTFTTVTQVAQPIYPRLKANGSAVTYRSAARAVLPVLPDLTQAEPRHEEKALRSANVDYMPRSAKQRLAYTVKGNKPGWVVFNVSAPDQLLEVSAAARYTVRSPSPAGCDFHFDVSTDGGKTWKQFGKADVPTDNEFSSGWVYGKADIASANVKSALVRVHLYAGGYQTGLMHVEMYGTHQTTPAQAATVTYAWKEAGQVKTHTEKIAAGAKEHTFQVLTGAAIVDEYVRIQVQ